MAKLMLLFVAFALVLHARAHADDEWEDVEYKGEAPVTEEEEEAWLERQRREESLHNEWSENIGWTDPEGRKSDGPKPYIEFLRPENKAKLTDENVIVEFFVHNVDPNSGVSAILYLGGGNPTKITDFRNSIHVTVTQLKPGTYTLAVVLVDKYRNPMNIEASISFDRVSDTPMTVDEVHRKAAEENFLDTRIYEVTMRYYSVQNHPESIIDQAENLIFNALAGDKSVPNGDNTTSAAEPIAPVAADSDEAIMEAHTRQILAEEKNPTAQLMKQKKMMQSEYMLQEEEEEEEQRAFARPFVPENGEHSARNDARAKLNGTHGLRDSTQVQHNMLFIQGALQLFNKENRDIQASLPLLSRAAALGNSNAHLFLAVLWTIGDSEVGGKINESAALFHWQECEKMQHPLCKMALAYRAMHGFGGVEKNCEDAAIKYRHAAQVTLAFATENAGFPPLHKARLSEYRDIQIEEKNEEIESFEEFKAEQGGEGAKEAHLFLGLHRYFGTGKSELDRSRALHHFEAAAEHGSPMAHNNLGTIYLNGVGVEQNHSRAYELFSTSAAQQDHWGINSLAVCHWNGYGVPANKSEGLRLYRLAASLGNPNAHFNLGNFYREGTKGLKRDYAKALQHLEFAARNGQADALFSVGLMQLAGEGIDPSCELAVNSFKKAAEHGPWGSTLQEAFRAFKNNDLLGAFFRYAIAAEVGYATAQANVAWLHENGYGRGELDSTTAAFEMYSLAAEQGDVSSLRKMADMHFNGMTSNGVDYAAAADFYQRAQDYDDHALFNLAYMYEHGLGVEKDTEKALEMYSSLADSDYENDAALPSKIAIARMRVIQSLQNFGILGKNVSGQFVTQMTMAMAALVVIVFAAIVFLAR